MSFPSWPGISPGHHVVRLARGPMSRGAYNAGRHGQDALKDAAPAAPLRRVSGLRFWALSLSTIFLSGKRNQCYCASMCLQRYPLVSLRDGSFEPVEKAKYLDVDTLGLEGLQPIEIPQNGQSFLWKSLEKNSRVLEKLAKKLGALRPAGARARAIPPAARGSPQPKVSSCRPATRRGLAREPCRAGVDPFRRGSRNRLGEVCSGFI